MKKNKRIKALILTPIAVILAFVITVVIIDRFFWMHFDYYFCTKPDGVSYYVNEVTDKTATIWLYQRSSAAIDRYGGYDYKVQGNTIYLGINVTYFWGQYFEMPTEIPIKSENKIEKIILCGKGKEKVIYDDSTGQENDNSNFEIASFAPANEETSNFESSSYYSDINSTQEQPSMNYNKLGEYSKKVLESIPDNVVYLKGKNTVIYKQEFERIISEYKMWGYQESEARDLAEQYLKKRESAYYEATRQGFKATDQEVKNIIEQEKTNVEKSDNKQQVYDYLQGLNMSIDQYWNSQFEKIRKEIAIDKYFTKEKEKFSSSSDLEEWKTYKEDLYSKLIKQQNYKTVN